MIKYFIKAFKLTNENIILTTPLVLFLLLFFVYLGISQNTGSSILSQILLTVTILFMFSAFFAGWLSMVKNAINLDKTLFESETEKAKASFALLKKIPSGIGEYFLPFLGAIILYTLLLGLVYIGIYQIGIHFIGNIGIGVQELNSAFTSIPSSEKLLASMSHAQLAKLSYWVILFFGSILLFYFVTMFWFVHIIYKTKNPLKAFFSSVKMIFTNFFDAIIMFTYITFINFFTTIISSALNANAITQFISMLISFYFVVYVVVLVFLYYENAINRKLETKNIEPSEQSESTASETTDNSSCGTDSIGEEQSGNTDSEDS